MDTSSLESELREEFARILSVPVDKLPGDVPPELMSTFLGVAVTTLSIWRTTGRYNLPYYKAGRAVRYRINDGIRFKIGRMRCTGGVIGEARAV